jgi:CRISPR system Cascade subunit CasB
MTDETKQVGDFVKTKISKLSATADTGGGKATFAKLRRGIGEPPGSMPELWDVTLDGLPESLQSRDGAPSKGEWAVHTALTLYALHQQGKDVHAQSMNAPERGFGRAVRGLVTSEDEESRVKRRFDAVATASSMEELAHHMRGLINLLKSKDIGLDYAMLARDIYQYQFEGSRDHVRLRWGQDFYFRKEKVEKNEE